MSHGTSCLLGLKNRCPMEHPACLALKMDVPWNILPTWLWKRMSHRTSCLPGFENGCPTEHLYWSWLPIRTPNWQCILLGVGFRRRWFTGNVVGHTRCCIDGMYLESWGRDIPLEKWVGRSVPLHLHTNDDLSQLQMHKYALDLWSFNQAWQHQLSLGTLAESRQTSFTLLLFFHCSIFHCS